MVRQARIEYAGAAYHVMGRGNQGRAIYAADRDRKRWLETVGERLGMGHYTRVTQAIRRMSRRPGTKLERMKRQLMALTSQKQPEPPHEVSQF